MWAVNSVNPARAVFGRGLALALALLLLAACTQPPPPPPPAELVVASGDAGAAVDTLSLAPGEWQDYELAVPAAIRADFDVLYLELDGGESGAVLELRSPIYWSVMASSASPARFVRGALQGVPQPVPAPAAPSTDAASPPPASRPAAVEEQTACRGPCVIFRATSETYYARVVNHGGSTVEVSLYLFGYDLQDDTEPQNDLRGTAPVLGAEVSGAIEVLGDQDYWYSPDDLAVTFAAVTGAELEAVVVGTGGAVVAGPYYPGSTFSVFESEAVRIRGAGNAVAGPPAASTYYLSSVPLPPGTPGRPPTHVAITANTNPNQPVDSRTFEPGQTVEYVLELPSAVRGREVLYVELDRNVGLEVRSGSGASHVASSSSSASFSSRPGSLAPDVGARPAAVDVALACRGSCVIFEPGAGSYRVYVTNHGGRRSIDLFAYGASFMDETEPQNDAPGSAPVLTGDDSGAIETIGDADYWRLAYGGTVAFDDVGGIALEAEIVDGSGKRVPNSGGPYRSGDVLSVFAGEYIRVWAADPAVAAAAANSSYFLEYLTTNASEGARR